MSIIASKSLRRAGLAALALATIAGAASSAQAATVHGTQPYVPADLAATAPAAASHHVATIWGAQPRQDDRSIATVAAQPVPSNKAPGTSGASN